VLRTVVLFVARSYRGTQRPPFPQTESQHNSFKVLCCGNFSQHNNLTVVLWKLSQHNILQLLCCDNFHNTTVLNCCVVKNCHNTTLLNCCVVIRFGGKVAAVYHGSFARQKVVQSESYQEVYNRRRRRQTRRRDTGPWSVAAGDC